MKKIMISILSAMLMAAMLLSLASCGDNNNDGKDSGNNTSSGSLSSSSDTDKKDTGDTSSSDTGDKPADSSSDTTAAPELKVEVGTVLEYKMAFYLDESVASNADDATDGSGNRFVQNISNGFARIDDEFMLNDEDTYQLFWFAGEEGNTFTIPLNVPASGKYTIDTTLFNGGDFITCQIFLGETLIADNLDCYNAAGDLYDYNLGSFDLTAGDMDLVIRCTGKNEASSGYVFAINSLKLTCEALS